jgi:putative transposase
MCYGFTIKGGLLCRINSSKPLYYRRRFPAEIISHGVWPYFRFCLRYRDVEEIMAKRLVAEVWLNLRQAAAVPVAS